jgi:hypothetical protein
MSVESWTNHALTVKAALQLGLHSPLSYKELSVADAVSNLRLWYSIVNQDRCVALLLQNCDIFNLLCQECSVCALVDHVLSHHNMFAHRLYKTLASCIVH